MSYILPRRPKQQPPDFIVEFIQLYRSLPALWKIKSPEYSNRTLKQEAYDKMIALCQTVEPDADKEYVVKKINALRGSFRKELNKVRASKDNQYEPQLWYYNLLLFTADQESNRYSITEDGSFKGIKEQISSYDEESNSNSNFKRKRQISPVPTPRSSKPSYTNNKKPFAELLYDKMEQHLENNNKDEFDSIGSVIGFKLRTLDEMQRIHCENLINRAIYLAQLGKLNENSDIKTFQ